MKQETTHEKINSGKSMIPGMVGTTKLISIKISKIPEIWKRLTNQKKQQKMLSGIS
jgi:hypothetical protein